MEEGADDKCKEAIEKALEYSPNSPEALQLMASYLFSMDQPRVSESLVFSPTNCTCGRVDPPQLLNRQLEKNKEKMSAAQSASITKERRLWKRHLTMNGME